MADTWDITTGDGNSDASLASDTNSKAYATAKARLNNASYSDLERLRAEFDEYQDGSISVAHYNLYDEWFASASGVKARATNMKGIQRHGGKYRVQKRVDGQLRKWTFDTLEQAVRKRDAIFAKVDAE